jgi:hypothetical protein
MPAAVEAFRRPTQHDLTISVVTRQEMEFVDLTASLSSLVEALGIRDGVLTVRRATTTTGLMINEHEPLLLDDLRHVRAPCAGRSFMRTTTSAAAPSTSARMGAATAMRCRAAHHARPNRSDRRRPADARPLAASLSGGVRWRQRRRVSVALVATRRT